MESISTAISDYTIRGVEYIFSINISEDKKNLVVEVQDKLTADIWRGNFDSEYLESVTHKTGNYKEFSVFCYMLQSALEQRSESVCLDLLTYSDLENMRNVKTGTSDSSSTKSTNLYSKRYLILIYAVEFDRIYYPLPLTYSGKPDCQSLRDTIKELRDQNMQLKQQGRTDSKDVNHELKKLKKEYEKVLREKEDIEAEFEAFKREIASTTKWAAAKEIRILKTIVKNLENDLAVSKTKNQRATNKRNDEYRQLVIEAEDLRARERTLKARVKSLTNELAMFKRSGARRANNPTSCRTSHHETSGGRLYSGQASRENSYSNDISRLSHLSRNRSRERSLSRDRPLSNEQRGRRKRSISLERGFSRDRIMSHRTRSPSPSADEGSYSRFNPTDYVRERGRKRKEAELKHRRNGRNINTSASSRTSRPDSSGQRSRENSYNSNISRTLRDRSLSRERSLSRDRYSRDRDHSATRNRSLSLDRLRSGIRRSSASPSAAGARYPRFDPTAYVKEKKVKRKESELKTKRELRGRMGGSKERKRGSSSPYLNGLPGRSDGSRSPSVGSLPSRSSSIELLSDVAGGYYSDVGLESDGTDTRQRRSANCSNPRKTSVDYPSPNTLQRPRKPEQSFKQLPNEIKTKKILASTPDRKTTGKRKTDVVEDRGDDDYLDRSDVISEIDARLDRLQQFMATSLS